MSRTSTGALVTAMLALACGDQGGGPPPAAPAASSRPSANPLPAPFDQTIPGSTARLHMRPIPPARPGRPPFFMSATEITWDLYDVFALRLDDPGQGGADGITRPSRPYHPPDRGFGHEGYPAMSVTFEAACAFCDWLTKRTGRRYRLPTDFEWEHAARAGAATRWCFGDDGDDAARHAWCAANSDDATHPVGTKLPNALGLFDMHGNVAEWCVTHDLQGVTCGGSYRDDPAGLACAARVAYSRAWQRSDPQSPKSRWWLSDGPFVGFRVVTDLETR